MATTLIDFMTLSTQSRHGEYKKVHIYSDIGTYNSEIAHNISTISLPDRVTFDMFKLPQLVDEHQASILKSGDKSFRTMALLYHN